MRMQEDKQRKNWSTGSESFQEDIFIKGLARGINSQAGKKTL